MAMMTTIDRDDNDSDSRQQRLHPVLEVRVWAFLEKREGIAHSFHFHILLLFSFSSPY